MDPPSAPTSQIYEFGPFRLDAASRVLLRDDRIVPLPPKVLETLVLLIENRGRLVNKDELLRSIWPDTYVEQNSLMHNVSVLRKVLGDAPDRKPYIETAPRRGYRFIGTVRLAGNEVAGRSDPIRLNRVRGIVALGAGVSILMIVAVALLIKPPVTPPLQFTPLTSYPGTEAFPTFSPDGRQVAFVWNGKKQDQFDIYVKAIGVDPPRRLTSDPESECHLAWSPDGAWIAFVHCGSTESSAPAGEVGLYVIPSSGGQRRKIAYIHDGGNPFGRPFTWSADGHALITAQSVGGTRKAGLFLLSRETAAQRRQLTSPQQGSWDTDPAVSPDGRTLAFVRWMAHGLADIYLVGLDKELAPQGVKRLTFENDFVTNLLWTNDGADLLYVAGNEGARGVWRVRARPGAAPKQVPALAQAGVHLALSRDGKLAYSRRYWDYDIWRAELDPSASSRNPSELIASTFSDAEPQYSPDGKSIAFQSNRSGAMEIWRSNADGAAATQVTSLHAEAGSPVWSPDSSEIAFDCRLNGNVHVYVVGIYDGKIRRLTADRGVQTTPAWSRDGKWIYFASKRTGRLEVWKVASRGGQAVQITRAGGFLASESVDGKFLFYAKTSEYPTTLWEISLETGKEEQIIDSLRHWSYFAVFGDGIYFIPERSRTAKFPSFQLKFYEFSKRSTETVAAIDKWPGVGFSVSPDRRWLLFAPSATHAGNLMLVENFR